MLLSDVTRILGLPPASGADCEITGIRVDSRQVAPGNAFIAIRGYATDGHLYIPEALSRGASVVIVEDRTYLGRVTGVPALLVSSAREAAGMLADAFHGHPSRHLVLVGVTGTNGKTTVTLLLDSIFSCAGLVSGVIGTLGRKIGPVWRTADRTTPDAIEFQSLLSEMLAAGVTHVAAEVSSHALRLHRCYPSRFRGAVFTNLTQDHLDFHTDLEEYLEAKLLLFTTYSDFAESTRPMVGAVNVDDAYGLRVAEAARCQVVTYGTNGGSDVRARSISCTPGGVSFDLIHDGERRPVRMQLTGHFNVHNALGAAACCLGLGLSLDHVVAGLEQLAAVPGRFERVSGDRPYAVIVDYAHTPDALHNVLGAGRAMSPRRLICVMGCGGNRDRGKRPKMGKVATELADVTIITSDNPRSEDPLAIIADIVGGVTGGEYMIEPDRRQAIFKAVRMCEPGDMVIIAGKGHETYQEFADHRIDFDDRVVAREAIAAREG